MSHSLIELKSELIVTPCQLNHLDKLSSDDHRRLAESGDSMSK